MAFNKSLLLFISQGIGLYKYSSKTPGVYSDLSEIKELILLGQYFSKDLDIITYLNTIIDKHQS